MEEVISPEEWLYMERRSFCEILSDEQLVNKARKYYEDGYLSYESRAVGILGWYKKRQTLNDNQRQILIHELSKVQKDDNGSNG